MNSSVSNIINCCATDILCRRIDIKYDEAEFESSGFVSDYARQIIVIVNYCTLGAFVNLLGTIANIINIVVFLKMGFAETINISLFSLAISDFFCLITLQWLNICFNPLFINSDIPFKSDEIEHITAGLPHVSFSRVTGLITAYISLERCLCVTMPLKVKAILTPKKTVTIMVSIFITMMVCMSPIYTVNKLGRKFYPERNKSLIGMVFAENRDEVLPATYAVNNFFGYLAFFVVIVCTVVLVQKLNSKTKWRQEATIQRGTETKDRKVVTMVTMISTIFLICYVPSTAIFIASSIDHEFGVLGRYMNLYHSMFTFAFLLETINSSVNIFVYLKMSTNYRVTFNRVFCRRAKK